MYVLPMIKLSSKYDEGVSIHIMMDNIVAIETRDYGSRVRLTGGFEYSVLESDERVREIIGEVKTAYREYFKLPIRAEQRDEGILAQDVH